MYQDVLTYATISWGARLCNDPELPPGEYDLDTCDAAFFCLITSNYYECPQSFLQEHINYVRFRMKCIGPNQKIYLQGEQPDTIAVCMTQKEYEDQEKEKQVKLENERLAKTVSMVYTAEGTQYLAKPAPFKFTCVDLPSSSMTYSRSKEKL